MKIRQYQVDAFATRAFEGNPAAVCPLDSWLDDSLLQAIAEENNLAETAFFVPADKGFALRWFSPVQEVDLCGHATLAAAHVIFEKMGYAEPSITFTTRSGKLFVERRGEHLEMDFPASVPAPVGLPEILLQGLGACPVEVLAAEDYMAVFDGATTVRAITPDPTLLSKLDRRGVIVTARGENFDFVSRFFAPKLGILEDPVTGSAHCQLAPYWSKKLGKTILNARQVSRRGGNLTCEVKGDRVLLAGQAITFMVAEIEF
jgi:predicted PhzF superfamily epimerase YddE/YHI9